jgi:hypothetical protein
VKDKSELARSDGQTSPSHFLQCPEKLKSVLPLLLRMAAGIQGTIVESSRENRYISYDWHAR